MEGVMMKNGDMYAVSVRKPDKTIVCQVDEYKSFIKNKKILSLPFIRGVFNFIDSMVLGMKTLMFSADFFMEDEEEGQTKEAAPAEEAVPAEDKPKEKSMSENLMMGLTVAASIALAIGIFMILPYFISRGFRLVTDSELLISTAEGIVRILIFMGYILLISRMKDIQRVFMYHGAEHKCINCIEHGMELNVENVMKSSKQHKRCGTSFLFFVIIISVILFMFIRVDSPVLRIVVRLALIPVIAGISYEIIRLAGASENPVVELLSKPGLMLQNMTTREPEPDMVEVAITSVEAVFDWKAYLAENFGRTFDEDNAGEER